MMHSDIDMRENISSSPLSSNSGNKESTTPQHPLPQQSLSEMAYQAVVRQRIINWISPVDFDELQSFHLSRSYSHKPPEILASDEFAAWTSGTQSIMWCRGVGQSYPSYRC